MNNFNLQPKTISYCTQKPALSSIDRGTPKAKKKNLDSLEGVRACQYDYRESA